MTDEDRRFWQQNVIYTMAIGRAISEHVTLESSVTKALEPFKNRISAALESLRIVHRHAQHEWQADGLSILRTMYDAHLQVLYMLADPAEAVMRAQLFLDYRWIEQRRMQNLFECNSTQLARTLLDSPKRAEGETERDENYQRLRPKYLTKNGKKVRSDWYPGNLYDLAESVGLRSECEILQRCLSGAIHSTPTALLSGNSIDHPDGQLHLGWRIVHRVYGRIAEHHAVPLDSELVRLGNEAMANVFDQIYDLPSGKDAGPH